MASGTLPRDDILPLIPAALLCIVAVIQLCLTRTEYLTPWKGGGFGMFSTTDASRRLEIFILGPAGEVRIEIPDRVQADARRAGILPSQPRLEGLARKVAAIEQADGEDVFSVRIQVLRPEYSIQTYEPRLQLIRETIMDLKPPRIE